MKISPFAFENAKMNIDSDFLILRETKTAYVNGKIMGEIDMLRTLRLITYEESEFLRNAVRYQRFE